MGSISFAPQTVSTSVTNVATLANVAALRVNSIAYSLIYISGYYAGSDGGEGQFWYNSADTTSADNGGTIIIDAGGRRYYRETGKNPYNARWFGAIGDGSADDTSALQNAMNASSGTGRNLYIPQGIFKTTSQLTIGNIYSGGNTVIGLEIIGAGIGGGGYKAGTTILYTGSGATAVLQVDSSLYRYCKFSDMSLMCSVNGGATYGLLFNDTQFSQHVVSRIGVGNSPSNAKGPSTAFAILAGSGGNGENILFEGCFGHSVDCFFYSNSGQAYVQEFHHCGATINTGGVYFNLAMGSGGGGINVFDFNGTGTQTSGISNTTVVWNQGSGSCLNFLGGRLEHVTQFYRETGGSPNIPSAANFSGMQIGIDFDSTNSALTLAAVLVITNTTSNIRLQSMNFFGSTGTLTQTFPVSWGGSGWSNIKFCDCNFQFFTTPPYVMGGMYNSFSQLRFEDCKSDGWKTTSTGTRMTSYDRNFDLQTNTAGKRRSYSLSGRAPSGTPSNLLIVPEITTSNGSAVTLAPPWVLSGSATISAYDWTTGAETTSSSPWAKKITIPVSGYIYQDITALPLNGAGNYNMDGTQMTLVTFQVFINFLNTNIGSGSLAIVDSVSGIVYDQYTWTAGGPPAVSPQLITLSTTIYQTSTLSYPRIMITNTHASLPLNLPISWMYVSGLADSMFTPSDSGPVTFSESWAHGAESAYYWSRLAIPYKSDAFGCAASTPLSNLQSDLYTSTTDGRLTYYANGAWWKTPRIAYGTVSPASGTWSAGDQILNSAPVAGGFLGWVCVTAGAPGTWKTFGVISS